MVPRASGKARGSPAVACETLPSTLARGCVLALEAPRGEVVIGWKWGGQAVVLARCAPQMGREGKKGMGWEGSGEATWNAAGWARLGYAHCLRLREAWVPDVPAGREGRGGESCQHAQAAALGAWPRRESLPGPSLPMGRSAAHTVGAS